jgi:phosphotransferase system enzyme I (PtsI)
VNIKGIGASAGIAIGKVYKFQQAEFSIEKQNISSVEKELEKLKSAIDHSERELEIIRDKTKETIDEEHAAVFDAHIQILKDPSIIDEVEKIVKEQRVNVEYAFHEVTNNYINMFESMEDEYMKERAADIKDVKKRVISHILDVKICDPSLIDEEVIVIAHDLTPSDTAQLNKKYVLGFATNIGGRTSHSAIMACSLEIPAVVGTKTLLEEVKDGELLIVDGINGHVILNPSEDELKEYKEKAKKYEEQKNMLKKFVDKKTRTMDGYEVELGSNIGSPNDLDGVISNGAEGIGLYRTEFLYMGKDHFPTEDEQFKAYKEVLEKMGDKPVVIRTLDIGGDKELSYMEMPKELNPFLGHRAIRLCLEKVDLFKTQLRALLRASAYGNLKIMFPMIATINDFKRAKEVLIGVKEEMIKEGIKISDNIEVGIMVEIPSTAILADQFAKEVDFFSIGTNDLIQYTFAADRMNEKVSYLYQPYNPSLLRLIKMVIDAAHKEGKWAGMCGEMAGSQLAIPLLLGLGLDEFSMSATKVLESRYLISKLNKKHTHDLVSKALQMNNNEDVVKLVEEYISEVE